MKAYEAYSYATRTEHRQFPRGFGVTAYFDPLDGGTGVQGIFLFHCGQLLIISLA